MQSETGRRFIHQCQCGSLTDQVTILITMVMHYYLFPSLGPFVFIFSVLPNIIDVVMVSFTVRVVSHDHFLTSLSNVEASLKCQNC